MFEDRKKHDLSPLIQVSGHYLVDDSDDDSLFINVCRDIGLNGYLCHLSVCKFLVTWFFAIVSVKVVLCSKISISRLK